MPRQRLTPDQRWICKFQLVDGELPVTVCRQKARILNI